MLALEDDERAAVGRQRVNWRRVASPRGGDARAVLAPQVLRRGWLPVDDDADGAVPDGRVERAVRERVAPQVGARDAARRRARGGGVHRYRGERRLGAKAGAEQLQQPPVLDVAPLLVDERRLLDKGGRVPAARGVRAKRR